MEFLRPYYTRDFLLLKDALYLTITTEKYKTTKIRKNKLKTIFLNPLVYLSEPLKSACFEVYSSSFCCGVLY